MAATSLLFATWLLMVCLLHMTSTLSADQYANSCPGAEAAVTSVVKRSTANDNTVPAALLRMHFHDCFIRGCDGSVLLDSTGSNKAEKDGPPNVSLHAFYVIDRAKEAVEKICPGVVSCADILAFAARDAVHLSGGPYWEVEHGRKDGMISKAIDANQLPAPTFNFTQLKQSFAQRSLSTKDLVVLSGGHTLGFAHCSSFQSRIHNFDASDDVDPTLNPSFAKRLQKICPLHNEAKNAGSTMDTTAAVFDNVYYKLLLQGMGLFSSDEALLTHPKTKGQVSDFASSQEEFFRSFVKSMIRMGSLQGSGAGEVRLNCRKVNS